VSRKRSSGVRTWILAALTILTALVACSGAAAQETIGQVAPATSLGESCQYIVPYDQFQVSVGEGAGYVVPAPGGAITSWSTNARSGFGQGLGLKIFRAAGPLHYTVVGHDGPRTLTPSTLNTFPVALPVQAGDVIGVDVPVETVPTACEFPTLMSSDMISFGEGDNADGSSFEIENTYGEHRVNVSATLLPPPTMAAIAPSSGTIKGGTGVSITGSNFADVKSVAFGTVPATSFSVTSESQITAIAPPALTAGIAPISVTTVAGTVSTGSGQFSYTAAMACVVPKLKGQKLNPSTRKLKRAGCRIGTVKKVGGATAKTGKVKKQNPKPGKVLAPGSKVNVKLGE
jgi:hypothetical protein